MRVVAVLGIGVAAWKSARTPRLSGRQSRAAVGGLEHAAARHRRCRGGARSRGSTRIECSLPPSGVPSWSPPHHALRCGCSLNPATPSQVAPPSSRAEQALRRGAGVPDAGLASRVPASARTCGRRCVRCPGLERRRPRGLLPGAAAVRRSGRPSGPRWPVRAATSSVRAVARVEHRVVDDVAEEMRAGELPAAARTHRSPASTSPCASRSAASTRERPWFRPAAVCGVRHGSPPVLAAQMPKRYARGRRPVQGGVEIGGEACNSCNFPLLCLPGATMTIKVGDKLPAGTLSEFIEVEGGGCSVGPNPFQVEALTAGKKVVIFGLPGAFTPTCSAQARAELPRQSRRAEGQGRGRGHLHGGQRPVRDGRLGARPEDRRQDPDDGRRQRRPTPRRSGSSSTSRPRAWACAASASRCWSTTASSRRSTSRPRASSRSPTRRRC